jgi:oligoribonuclease (3'-5' exoribonuclease)
MQDFGFNCKGFIGIDCETTGTDFNSSQVIQIGAVFCDGDLNILHGQEWNISFVQDSFTWSSSAEAVHKIPMEVAVHEHKTSISAFRDEFSQLIKTYYGKNCLSKDIRIVAAQTYFDYVMILNSLYDGLEKDLPFSHRLIDVNSIGFLWGRSSLRTNAEYFGITVDETKLHSALYDAELHIKVFSNQFSRCRAMRLLENSAALGK